MKLKYYFSAAKLVLLVGLPIVLLTLPKDFFDTGDSVCLLKILFDFECYACGMTRACMHLIHFDFENAFAYNMASFLAFPALAVVWVQWFIKEWKTFRKYKLSSTAAD
jgi:hypothetical protein